RMMMRSAAARIALLQASREAFPEWIASHGIDCHFAETGTDHVFRTERELQEYLPGLEALAGIGVASEVIDGADYERQEPAVLPGVVATVRFPGDASLRPDRYAAGLARALQQAGGSMVEYSEVRGIDESGDGVRVSTTTGEFLAGDVVLAVGAWSPKLARSLKLPRLASLMQPGKGYSITYDRPALAPKRPLTLQERSVCVSVWESGYRLGSTMEFSGFDTTLNRRRLDALERAAREYLHEGVGPVKREEWYGWRPMMGDDVPVIGAVPGRRRQWLATGHGMLGVSMSVATARLLADPVTGETPAVGPAPHGPGRFRRRPGARGCACKPESASFRRACFTLERCAFAQPVAWQSSHDPTQEFSPMANENEHNVGKGTGAVAGAVAGGAIGSAAGPVGTAAGAVIGGVAGYAAGGAIAESVNPEEYDRHWQQTYSSTPYYSDRYNWNDYQPAYQYGYNRYGEYKGQRFEDVEPQLERD